MEIRDAMDNPNKSSTNKVSTSSGNSQMNIFHNQDDADPNRSALNQFRIEQKFTDITFVLEEKKFFCHRVIMAWGSSYFENVFNKDTLSTVVAHELQQMGIGAKWFEYILNFIYTNSADCINVQNAFPMYKFARILGIKGLEMKVAQFIKINPLEVDDQVNACELAHEWGDRSFFDVICKQLGKQDCFEKLMQEKYRPLCYDIFRKIIENTEISDDDKKNAVAKWVDVDVQRIPLKEQLLQLVNKKQKPVAQRAPKVAKPKQNPNKRRRSNGGPTEEDNNPSKVAKTQIKPPNGGLKIFADTDGDSKTNAFSIISDCKLLLLEDKINENYDRLRSVRLKGYEYFLTFKSGKNLFWMVNEKGKKKNLKLPRIVVEDFRLQLISNTELFLYHVNCMDKKKSLMRYNFDENKWFYNIEVPIQFLHAGVAEWNGLYYLCGGSISQQAYRYDYGLLMWEKLPNLNYGECRTVACSHNGKIYVYGIDKGNFEVFDPTFVKWESLNGKTTSKRAEFYKNEKFLISYGDNDLLLIDVNGSVAKYNIDGNKWSKINSFQVNKILGKDVTSIRVKDITKE